MNVQRYKFISDGKTQIWKRELEHVLHRDIHQEGLGCYIDNTHIKLGDIHLGSFFEAQFLFGNAYWISIFANSLAESIHCAHPKADTRIHIIGYETYIEPVVLMTKELLTDAGYTCVFSHIYEAIKNLPGNIIVDERLRSGTETTHEENDVYVFVCGIASTLHTHYKMARKVSKEIIGRKKEPTQDEINELCDKSGFYSIIQILPTEFNDSLNLSYELLDNKKLEINKANSVLVRKDDTNHERIVAKYLVCVYSVWQRASECKWCFQEDRLRPIVDTNDISIVPFQMIERNTEENNSNEKEKDSNDKDKKKVEDNSKSKICFFQRKKENNSFEFLDYLYYDHINRNGNHYQYYIRTNSLLKKILSDNELCKIFDSYCDEIKKGLKIEENRIDILIAPLHYSNEQFVSAISQKVFHSKCEIISFNPTQEFRSNFECKYSNYSYILKKLKGVDPLSTNVYFHFIDDELIMGNSYYRAKSFVSSLLDHLGLFMESKNDENKNKENIHLFESVILLVNRNSNASKSNYIERLDKFFSFIDIRVPSLRNYGDSCFLCGKTTQATRLKEKSALYTMEKHWAERENYHKQKNLEEEKKLYNDPERDQEINERHFRRFYCEDLMYQSLRHHWSVPEEIYRIILTTISKEISKKNYVYQYEYLISFIVVLSRPFLYYRENVKKAVHAIVLFLLRIMNINCRILPETMITRLRDMNITDIHNLEDCYHAIDGTDFGQRSSSLDDKIYYLYSILLKRISEMESCYLFSVSNIEKAIGIYYELDLVKELEILKQNSDDANKEEIEKEIEKKKKRFANQFSMLIRSSIKKITGASGGRSKAIYLDRELEDYFMLHPLIKIGKSTDCSIDSVLVRIYLENLDVYKDIRKYSENNNLSFQDKYRDIFTEISDNHRLCLAAEFTDKSDNNYIIACSRGIDPESFKVSPSFDEDDDICYIADRNLYAVKCFDASSEPLKTVYFLIQIHDDSTEKVNLEPIRRILYHRYTIASEVKKVAESGELYQMYRDENWAEILTQPKSISHGQSEDINEHINLLESIYQSYANQSKYEFQNESIDKAYNDVSVYSAITLFSNKIISFLHCIRIGREMEKHFPFEEALRIDYLPECVPKYPSDDIDTGEDNKFVFYENDDFNESDNNNFEELIKRLNLYIESIKKEIPDLELNDQLLFQERNAGNKLQIINLKLDGYSNYWIPIAFIHILVKNALIHGNKDKSIKVYFSQNEKNERGIDLVVKNHIKDSVDKKEQGITQKALSYCLNNGETLCEFKEDGDQYKSKIHMFFEKG